MLTVMIINLSLDEKIKAFRIGDQAQVQAEIWLFDPPHRAENARMEKSPLRLKSRRSR